jgi:hypothetical protein
MTERCHMEGEYFIPGCMGAAAACGCGKTLAEIKSNCTCKPKPESDDYKKLIKRIETLEETIEKLTAGELMKNGRI